MLPNREWLEVARAIQGAAQLEGHVWYTDDDFMYHYKVIRHSLGGAWKQFNISRIQREKMPDDEEIYRVVEKMYEQLYQPIIDLPWEDYFWFEPEPETDWRHSLFRSGVISVNEYREILGFKEDELCSKCGKSLSGTLTELTLPNRHTPCRHDICYVNCDECRSFL